MLVYVDNVTVKAIFQALQNKVATTGTFSILILVKAHEEHYFIFIHALICILHMMIMSVTLRCSFCMGAFSVVLHSCLLPFFGWIFSFTLVQDIWSQILMNETWRQICLGLPWTLLNSLSVGSLSGYCCIERTVSKRTKPTTWNDASISVAITVIQILAVHGSISKNMILLWKVLCNLYLHWSILFIIPSSSAIPHLEYLSWSHTAFCPLGSFYPEFFSPLFLPNAHSFLNTKLLLLGLPPWGMHLWLCRLSCVLSQVLP